MAEVSRDSINLSLPKERVKISVQVAVQSSHRGYSDPPAARRLSEEL